MDQFRLLARHQFTGQQWDDFLSKSVFRHPALQSWYLDVVCPHWSILVKGDFEAAMPVFVNRKMGVKYAVKPYLVQQMGCISPIPSQWESLLDKLPRSIKLVEIPGNHRDRLPEGAFLQNNYCLSLDQPYESIKQGYNSNTKRNIKKALKFELQISTTRDCNQVYDFFIANNKKNGIQPEDYAKTKLLIETGLNNQLQTCYLAKNTTGEILSAALFTPAFGKNVYSLAASSELGVDQNAMFLLIDSFIQQHAGQEHAILDFEGSNIDGIARFYRGFGAVNQPYPFIKINRLPWPVRFLKK